MESDRIKWNKRYESEPFYLGKNPSRFLIHEIEHIKMLAPGRAALDVACGEGRNSIYLAKNGFMVTGIDISDSGLAKAIALSAEENVTADFRRIDLINYQIEEKFDLILNFNFLLRGLIPWEISALNPGGLLMFDSILESPQLLKTHNPDFLLRKGELERIFGKYEGKILFSEEIQEGDMPTARLLFQKSGKA